MGAGRAPAGRRRDAPPTGNFTFDERDVARDSGREAINDPREVPLIRQQAREARDEDES